MLPKPKAVKPPGKLLTAVGPSTTFARPRNSASVPSVTTRDGRPTRATSSPLRSPPSAPTTRTIGIPTSIGTPAAHSQPRIAPDSPIIDSTERSISPVMMISVMGRATIATSITALVRFAKLGPVRKNFESRVPSITSSTRITSSTDSQRRRPDARWKSGLLGGDAPLATLDEGIGRDGHQDHRAVDHLEQLLRHLEQQERVVDQAQEERTERRADDRARAAGDRDPADHCGGDDLERDARCRRRVDRPELHPPQDAGDAGEKAAGREGTEDHEA